MKNKRILLTGSDGSLGAALRERFELEGAVVVGLPKGISNKAEIERQMQSLAESPVNYIILNDGHNRLSWIGTTPESDQKIISVNVLAPYWVLNAAVALQPSHPAVVLFIGSQTYRIAQRTTSLYCASKAAATMLMKVAARELAPKGWRVNLLAPGKIYDTMMSEMTDAQVNLLRGWTQDQADHYAKNLIPAGRVTTKSEVVDGVMWALRSPEYVNGAALDFMGGV